MSFTVDKQTLDDLNLLGKYRSNSIYNVFSRTHTQGGEMVLEQMFRTLFLMLMPLIKEVLYLNIFSRKIWNFLLIENFWMLWSII